MQTLTVDVPRCWADLLEIEDFTTCGQEVRAGDRAPLPAVDDPKPYYDNSRVIAADFDGGAVQADVTLNSGQSNYWLEVGWFDREGFPLQEGEPSHDLADGEEHEYEDYKVILKLV